MMRLALAGVAAAIIATVNAAPAAAQARTFVSGFGSDSNPCSLSSPCRSFQHAHDLTTAGGEVTVLDPAGYGAVTISKPISIVNDGVGEAGVTVTTPVDAVTVTAGASDVVNLRGLTLVGSGSGHFGIILTSAGTLNIQNCVIRGFNSAMTLAPSGANRVNVSDTIVSNNANGINYFPTGTGTTNTIFFTRVQVLGSQTSGFTIGGNDETGGIVRGMATNSAASGNGSSGFAVSSISGGATAIFAVVDSQAIGNTTGVSSSATTFNATLVLTRTTIAGNTAGFDVAGNSRIDSYGDNQIFDGGNTGSLTPLADQ